MDKCLGNKCDKYKLQGNYIVLCEYYKHGSCNFSQLFKFGIEISARTEREARKLLEEKLGISSDYFRLENMADDDTSMR